ncbi:PREDICTED: 21 kDa protein-like [Ipomoea nil]|uniref:21 kDa protein-like n=1 Tax=Ipomoea nil TaxID=35883 RepID=UPI0009015051|nr:PREDICTED: 21 kDa protein-like [Ipomoea nil]
MKTSVILAGFLLFTVVLHFRPPSAAALLDPYSASFVASPTATEDAEFIRNSCETTLYPQLCYASLSGYASAVQRDTGRLARVAIGVSLKKAKRMAAYVNNLSRQADYGADHRGAAALHDCFSTLGDSVDQMRDSLQQMKQLGGGGGAEELRFQLSNVQTWMSAAETNEDTCVDGFDDVAEGPLKSDVYDGIVKVKQVTSNALALVNAFANKISIP